MPELPEVETVVRGLLAGGLTGSRILNAQVQWHRSVATHDETGFNRALRGRRIEDIRRRGKYIVIGLSGELWMLVHLRMSGSLQVCGPDSAPPSHTRVRIDLDQGRRLLFVDPRKFGRIWLVGDPASVVGHLGPEPLSEDFTPAVAGAAFQRHRRMIKPLLLDQHVVAGIGNIYADEALWLARIHPRRLSNALSPAESAALRDSIRSVLRKGIESKGTTLGRGVSNFRSPDGRGRNQDRLHVFRRTGQPCPHCGTTVKRIIVGQRATHFCPECQPLRPGRARPSSTEKTGQ